MADRVIRKENHQMICFEWFGGRCRIRTCDFHRVKVALYR